MLNASLQDFLHLKAKPLTPLYDNPSTRRVAENKSRDFFYLPPIHVRNRDVHENKKPLIRSVMRIVCRSLLRHKKFVAAG